MASGGEFLNRILPASGGGGFVDMVMWIGLGATILMICGGFLYYWFKRRKSYNIKVEFRLPRDVRVLDNGDGTKNVVGVIKKEWGKGFYDANTGTVYLKRKKLKDVPMKPFNVKEFLSDSNILTVLQVGIEDYRPVLERSYLEVEDLKGPLKDENGNELQAQPALINAKIDTSESKSWRNNYERERKSTYTIAGWLHENGQLVGFGFILISIFVGFAIVYSKIGG